METRDLIIIGAGPAGISAAIAAKANGIRDILVLDRLPRPGGILPQCLHRGFEYDRHNSALSGPEYAELLLRELGGGAELRMDSSVLEITAARTVTVSGAGGVYDLHARAVVLATGCRERPIGSLPIYGTRPAGVFTAGSVQKMLNLSGYNVGSRAVVLGSGDVGMIVAHHLAERGVEVAAVIEKEAHIGGLARNKRLYIDTHSIPLLTGRTVTELHGMRRLEAVTVCCVDNTGKPVPEYGYRLECDTLISSVGLIPELELMRGLPEVLPWLFICGNARRVHSLVTSVKDDGALAGELAASYLSSSTIS